MNQCDKHKAISVGKRPYDHKDKITQCIYYNLVELQIHLV